MEQRHVQEPRTVLRLGGDPPAAPAGRVVEGGRPAVRALDDRDPVRPQEVQLAQPVADRHALDIGIAGQQQVAAERLDEIGARLARRSAAPRSAEQRMLVELAAAVVEQPGHARGGLRDQPDAAMGDRIAHEALAGEAGIAARRPARRGVAREARRSRRRATPWPRRAPAWPPRPRLRGRRNRCLIRSSSCFGGPERPGSEAAHPRACRRRSYQRGQRPDERVEPVGRAAGREARPDRSRTSGPRARERRRHGPPCPCS